MANNPNTIEELSYKLINIITLGTAGWEVKLENCLEDYKASILAEIFEGCGHGAEGYTCAPCQRELKAPK